MKPLRVLGAIALIAGVSIVLAGTKGSYGDRPDHGFLSAHVESPSQQSILDELENQPAPAVEPGHWTSVRASSLASSVTDYQLDLSSDGRFASTYTVKADNNVVLTESYSGSYAIQGRTIAFDLWVDGRHIHRRAPIEKRDDTHLLLTTVNEGPIAFTYRGAPAA